VPVSLNDRKLGPWELAVRVAVVLVFATLTGFLSSDSAASSFKSSGRIAFTVFANSEGDLYTVTLNGSQRRQLTRDRAVEQYPVWSPDGRSIAYEKDGLYKVPATGGRPRLLLSKSSLARVAIASISDLSWSPRGRFAFTATKKFLTPFEVWTYRPNGRLQRITGYGLHPTWSPAGTRIAYGGKSGIFIVGANGRRRRHVPGTTRADSSPMWSPDGKWIAVSRTHTDKERQQVFSIDILSLVSRLRIRIVTGRFIVPAAWSPESDAILFERSSGPPPYGPRRLFIVAIHGGQPRPVPGTDDAAGPASWHR
jgi:Tol biopolymer transport system component